MKKNQILIMYLKPMAAIIGISGVIGGIFLRKLKKEKDDDNKHNNYYSFDYG